MAVEIKVPDMGESVIEATVARWMKQEGDTVTAGEPLVELETDKVNLEVGSQQAGVLQRIAVQPGGTVKVGDVLGYVEAGGAGGGAESEPPAPAEKPAAEAKPVAEARPGDAVPYEGGAAEREKSTAPSTESTEPAAGGATAGPAAATPVAIRMAQELGIDLSQVKPSAGGRITKEDVQAFAERSPRPSQPASAEAKPPQPAQAAPIPQPAAQPPSKSESAQPAAAQPTQRQGTGRETRQRMSRRRQTIARRLVEAQQTAAMLTTFNEVDMSRVMDLRKRRRETFKERFGVDLGFMSFFTRATIGALKAFPRLNAEIDGDEIVLKHYYDIGIAIGAEEGLVVPVIRDADRMSFAEIEKAIRDYATKVREGTLSLDDLRGGTFTITNGGVFGSLLSTPILNPPQVGILGMHKIQERAVVVNGEIVARPMMYLALSYDHRIVDGREAVQFLVRLKELVEDPEALLFG